MNASRLLLTRRLRPRDLYLLDAALALVVAAPVCGYAALESPVAGGGVTEPVWASLLTGALIGGPVAVRRRHPVAVAGFVTAASATALASGVIPDYAAAATAVTLGLALYAVGLLVPDPRSVATAVACLTVTAGALAVAADELWSRAGAVVYACVIVTPGWVLGWVLRERRAQAQRASAQLMRQAASDERLRVARELHDIVGHTMSLIAVKASVAVHVAETRPQEALDALRVIETTSRDALAEMRHLLGALRDDAPYAPAPGLDDLRTLAAQASVGGVDVRLDVHAGVEPPEAVGLSAYRIVQEALTNVVKHAAPASCRVTVAVDPGELRIEVTDDGRRPVQPNRAGHGLIGMRERAALHGGEFSAGRHAGGYTVTARLPWRPVTSPDPVDGRLAAAPGAVA